jgi:hypothetical protein
MSLVSISAGEPRMNAYARALLYAAIAILVIASLMLVRAQRLDAAQRQAQAHARVAELTRTLDRAKRSAGNGVLSAIGDSYELAIREGYRDEFRVAMLNDADGAFASLWKAHCDARVKKLGDSGGKCH